MIRKLILIGLCIMMGQSMIQADDIGYVDMRIIMSEYTEAKDIQSKIEEKIKTLEKEFKEKIAKIEKEKDEKKKRELSEKTREEFMKEQQQLQAFGEQETAKLIGQVMEVAQVVAREVGVDIIVDKRVVYFGGMPMTNLVLAKLNRKDK